MFKNETKNRMMAMAIVAMFMVSAFALVFAPADADPAATGETGTDSYTINLMKGEQFIYRPSANIDDTTLTWSGSTTGNGMTTVDGAQAGTQSQLTYIPTDAMLDKTVVLTAAHPASNQSAITQTITFNAYDPLTYTATNGLTGFNANLGVAAEADSASMDVSVNTPTNSTITVITANGGLNPRFSNVAQTFNATENDNYSALANSPFTVTPAANSNTVTITTNSNTLAQGYYKITVDCAWATSSAGNALQSSQSQTVTVIIHVVEGVSILAGQEFIAIAGEPADTHDVDLSNYQHVTTITPAVENTSTAPAGNSNVISTVDTSIAAGDNVAANGKLRLTVDPSQLVNMNVDSSGKTDMTITISAVGTETNGSTVTDFDIEETAVVHVYKSLRFITTPTISDNKTRVTASAVNGLDVLVSTVVANATKIVYYWGDGSNYTNNVTDPSEKLYVANHTYDRPGTYYIRIVASNDLGSTSYITPYNTGLDDIELFPVGDHTLKVGKIKTSTDGDMMTLKANVEVSEPMTTTVTYTWFMKEKDAEEEIAIEGDDNFILNANGSLTINTANENLKDDTKFILKVSALFAGDEEPTEKSVSYTYKDTSTFMENHGLLFIVFIVLAILVFALTYFGFQFIPYQYVIGFVFIVLAAIAFVTNDFGFGLWKF